MELERETRTVTARRPQGNVVCCTYDISRKRVSKIPQAGSLSAAGAG